VFEDHADGERMLRDVAEFVNRRAAEHLKCARSVSK
jgi:hypothetical protein